MSVSVENDQWLNHKNGQEVVEDYWKVEKDRKKLQYNEVKKKMMYLEYGVWEWNG